MKNPITPCLWMDGTAQAAAQLYVETFADAKLLEGGGMVANVQVGDLRLMLLDGGPMFKVNPAISFFYHCRDEAEIDRVWAALAEGGSALMPLGNYPFARKYGWIADKFGVNWQLMLSDQTRPERAYPSIMFTGEVCGRAEEAIGFYTSLFQNSKVGELSRYGADQAPDKEGTLNYGEFTLDGQVFVVMDSAQPHKFSFTEGNSLFISCETQDEIDYFWSKLTEGGEEGRCGWLKDKFGVSWQVVPRILGELMSDPEKTQRVVAAFMPMNKFIIADLLKA